MHFFRAREVADDWTRDRPGVVVLDVEESFELARVHWIDRKRSAARRQQRA